MTLRDRISLTWRYGKAQLLIGAVYNLVCMSFLLLGISFDCWFFLKERTSINKAIVESRMGMPIEEYLDKCIESVQGLSEKSLISGLGELAEGDMKSFVRHGLKDELISLLTMFKAFPYFA